MIIINVIVVCLMARAMSSPNDITAAYPSLSHSFPLSLWLCPRIRDSVTQRGGSQPLFLPRHRLNRVCGYCTIVAYVLTVH